MKDYTFEDYKELIENKVINYLYGTNATIIELKKVIKR